MQCEVKEIACLDMAITCTRRKTKARTARKADYRLHTMNYHASLQQPGCKDVVQEKRRKQFRQSEEDEIPLLATRDDATEVIYLLAQKAIPIH